MSGALGADTFYPPPQDALLDAMPAPDDTANSTKNLDWRAGLDFSTPPLLRAEDVHEAGLQSEAAPFPINLKPRIITLALALALLVAWIGVGRSNPLQPARNRDADAAAERVSPPDTSDATEANDARPGATNVPDRFDFASRMGAFVTLARDNAGSASDAGPEEVQQPAPIMGQARGEIGLVMLRNLPVGSALSSGTQISPTAWALARSELNGLVVTLPPRRRGSVKADIEVAGIAGSPMGRMTVEIRERPVLKPPVRRVHAGRMSKRRAETRTATATVRSAPSSPAAQMGAAATPAIAKQAQTANSAAALALVANPALKPIIPQLPFLPGPMSDTSTPASETVGQQILINLGVMPRAPASSVGAKK